MLFESLAEITSISLLAISQSWSFVRLSSATRCVVLKSFLKGCDSNFILPSLPKIGLGLVTFGVSLRVLDLGIQNHGLVCRTRECRYHTPSCSRRLNVSGFEAPKSITVAYGPLAFVRLKNVGLVKHEETHKSVTNQSPHHRATKESQQLPSQRHHQDRILHFKEGTVAISHFTQQCRSCAKERSYPLKGIALIIGGSWSFSLRVYWTLAYVPAGTHSTHWWIAFSPCVPL